MNGLDRITSRIEAEAKAEVDAILDAGMAETNRVVDGWRARIDAESRALAEKNQKAAAEREERLISAAGMDARKTLLAAKQEMVDAAYARALESLCALSGEEKVARSRRCCCARRTAARRRRRSPPPTAPTARRRWRAPTPRAGRT